MRSLTYSSRSALGTSASSHKQCMKSLLHQSYTQPVSLWSALWHSASLSPLRMCLGANSAGTPSWPWGSDATAKRLACPTLLLLPNKESFSDALRQTNNRSSPTGSVSGSPQWLKWRWALVQGIRQLRDTSLHVLFCNCIVWFPFQIKHHSDEELGVWILEDSVCRVSLSARHDGELTWFVCFGSVSSFMLYTYYLSFLSSPSLWPPVLEVYQLCSFLTLTEGTTPPQPTSQPPQPTLQPPQPTPDQGEWTPALSYSTSTHHCTLKCG